MDKTPSKVSLGVNDIWSIAAIAMIPDAGAWHQHVHVSVGRKGTDARLMIGNVTALLRTRSRQCLYPNIAVPLNAQKWLALNPMASFVEAFKCGIFRNFYPLISSGLRWRRVSAIVLLSFGLLFFTWRSDVEEMAAA